MAGPLCQDRGVSAALRWLTSPLTNRATYRRWAYLIVGGAMLVPYLVLFSVLLQWVMNGDRIPDFVLVLAALAVMVGVIVVTSFIPAVRVLEGTAASELLGGPIADQPVGRADSWLARWRAAAWFVMHVIVGGALSFLSVLVPILTYTLLVAPFTESIDYLGFVVRTPGGWTAGWAPVAGIVLLAALAYAVAAVGGVLAMLAPTFIGPSEAERVAALERQAERLAERNRLARELHDSVGHALTITTIQAGAARRVLDSDPEFARQALAAIEEAGRAALDDLDHVLGLLREDGGSTTPQPTLAELDRLLEKTRSAGVTVEVETAGDVAHVPSAVSREAYRIVQEGLTNALRHAGKVPVTLRMTVHSGRLELEMTNPIGPPSSRADARRRTGGGRGLHGISERVTILRGQMAAAAEGDTWRIAVSLPLRSTT